MNHFFRYIYTDNINICSFDKACELCYGAKKYMLPHLVKECTRYLWSDLYPRNACRAYEFARLFEENVLMEKCLQVYFTYVQYLCYFLLKLLRVVILIRRLLAVRLQLFSRYSSTFRVRFKGLTSLFFWIGSPVELLNLRCIRFHIKVWLVPHNDAKWVMMTEFRSIHATGWCGWGRGEGIGQFGIRFNCISGERKLCNFWSFQRYSQNYAEYMYFKCHGHL